MKEDSNDDGDCYFFVSRLDESLRIALMSSQALTLRPETVTLDGGIHPSIHSDTRFTRHGRVRAPGRRRGGVSETAQGRTLT